MSVFFAEMSCPVGHSAMNISVSDPLSDVVYRDITPWTFNCCLSPVEYSATVNMLQWLEIGDDYRECV
jgi:hypothetical protein